MVLRILKKTAVAIVGFSVIIVGCILLVLPGPGIAVILAGIAILAIEFEWAKRHLERSKTALRTARRKLKKD